jgi:hypothetical protein
VVAGRDHRLGLAETIQDRRMTPWNGVITAGGVVLLADEQAWGAEALVGYPVHRYRPGVLLTPAASISGGIDRIAVAPTPQT